jgi:hypothetical protein
MKRRRSSGKWRSRRLNRSTNSGQLGDIVPQCARPVPGGCSFRAALIYNSRSTTNAGEAAMITGVAELLTELEKRELNKAHAHVRYWFRGQSKAGLALQPAVYRPSFGQYTNEEDRFQIEKHLYEDFRGFSAGIRTGRETDADIYFLQQHYRMPTRLLDWTSNALAALYFVCTEHDGEDGELFFMDAYKLSEIGIATSRHPVFKGAVKALVDWSHPDVLPDFIFAVRPDHFDRRMSLQRSCFTFHVPKEKVLVSTDNNSVVSWKVNGVNKSKIMRQLSLLGIDHFSVYGDLEHLAKTLTGAYTSQK